MISLPSNPVAPARRTAMVMALVVAMLSIVLATNSRSASSYGGFSDVPAGTYYAEAVAWMADEGITAGTSPGCFSPNDLVTRAQSATFLHRLAGSPNPSQGHPFNDVTAGWQQASVSWMYENGFTTGISANQFAPDRPITRGEFAAFLFRFEDPRRFDGSHPFGDVTAEWQQEPVAFLYENDITTGVGTGVFAPDREITRAEAATMIWRYAGEPTVSPNADTTCGNGGGGNGGGGNGGGGNDLPTPIPPGDFVSEADLGSSVGVGVVGSVPTSSTGSVDIETNGTVLENVVVNGCIHVDASNVTIRNVIVNCDFTYPIRAENADNLVVEYSKLDCENNSSKGLFISDSSNFRLDRIEITGCDDQMFIESGLGTSYVTNSVFHNQAPGSDSHTDGIQLGTFERTTGRLVVDGNWWQYNRQGCCQNAVMFLSSSSAITAQVSNNYLDGDFGTHLLRCHNDSECIVENNVVPFEPDGFVVHSTSSGGGVARCNRYSSGQLIPNDLFNGIPVDNSDC